MNKMHPARTCGERSRTSRTIYLDYAATTPTDSKVFKEMLPYFEKEYGNPSELHQKGVTANKAIQKSRQQIANALNCQPEEIIFTSCATESINLAHKGLIEALSSSNLSKSSNPPHVITSHIEHKAVLETCKRLEKLGWAKVTYLPVDKFGAVSVKDVEKAITPQTVLVSIMYVNNEVGTIQPIAEISALIRKINKQRAIQIPNTKYQIPLFLHTDATQALPYLDCDVNKLGVDLLSFTGHKIYAPKGIGVSYARKGTPFVRQIDGGGQENNLRAGTENVPYIVGLGKAVELAIKNRVKESARLKVLSNQLIPSVLSIPGTQLTGHPDNRAPHIVSFTIEGVEGESLMLLLSDLGIVVSTGSACTSQNLSASHVLTAMGVPVEISHGSLRLSLGKYTTKKDLDYAVSAIKKVVEKLRAMAPKL